MPDRSQTAAGRLVLLLAAGCLAAGCGVIVRPTPTMVTTAAPDTRSVDPFRIASEDDDRWRTWVADWSLERQARGLDGVRALALSGGGANGAYGAGVMVGWTRAGTRPEFDLVTGVSTGALIAPFAFVGPSWDARLAAAYGDPGILDLGRTDLGWLSGPSLRSGRPLRALVRRHVDLDLLRAIAARHRAGGRLLVATTDLDGQRSMIWDLGAIADAADRAADPQGGLALIRSVLVASASLPGVLPPELIRVDPVGGHAEMHVDGGVTVPFFFVPERMHFWRPEAAMRPLGLHLVVNGQIGSRRRVTGGGFVAIVERSADTLGRADARAQMRLAQAFASRNGAPLAWAAIPDDEAADPLGFTPRGMSRLFDLGLERAARGTAFVIAPPLDGPDGP